MTGDNPPQARASRYQEDQSLPNLVLMLAEETHRKYSADLKGLREASAMTGWWLGRGDRSMRDFARKFLPEAEARFVQFDRLVTEVRRSIQKDDANGQR